MNFRLLVLALISFTLFSINGAFAQEAESGTDEFGGKTNAIYLGPVVGYNRSMHNIPSELASFADNVPCPTFKNGTANGFHVGLFYEQPFSAKSAHSVIARAMFSTLPASFTVDGDNLPSLADDGAGGYKTIYSTTQHTLDVNYNMLAFDVMYKFKAVGELVLTVGPTFDLMMTKKILQKYKIIAPDNIQFIKQPNVVYEDNYRTIVVNDNEIKEGAGLRAAIKAGIQYEIRLGGRTEFIPGFFYNYAITKVTSTDDWRVNALQFSVDVRFTL
jgi:hypothetical protein